MSETQLSEVMAELDALADPKVREANEKRGDDHGVNLSKLRELAKRLKTQHELAAELWATDDTAARLLALLICRPKLYEADELDAMLREARAPKVHDWLVNYVVKKNPHAEELRLALVLRPGPGGRQRRLGADHRPGGQEPRRARPDRAARHRRVRDEGRPGPPAVGDEPLPGRDRHPARRPPPARDRHR